MKTNSVNVVLGLLAPVQRLRLELGCYTLLKRAQKPGG